MNIDHGMTPILPVTGSAKNDGTEPGLTDGAPKNGSTSPPKTAISTLASRNHSDHASAVDFGLSDMTATYRHDPRASFRLEGDL